MGDSFWEWGRVSANYDKLQDVGAQGWGLTDVVGTGQRSSNYTLRHSNGTSGRGLHGEGEGGLSCLSSPHGIRHYTGGKPSGVGKHLP